MTDAVQQRYARFAAEEAPGRSDLYEEWASGIAADPQIQDLLALIPETRRQPPLVFAVMRSPMSVLRAVTVPSNGATMRLNDSNAARRSTSAWAPS